VKARIQVYDLKLWNSNHINIQIAASVGAHFMSHHHRPDQLGQMGFDAKLVSRVMPKRIYGFLLDTFRFVV
jgi:hypothetical protein